jgi:hypothetical protein
MSGDAQERALKAEARGRLALCACLIVIVLIDMRMAFDIVFDLGRVYERTHATEVTR